MGLRDTFQSVARTTMQAFGNVNESCTYHQLMYAVSGSATGTDQTTIPNLSVIREDYGVEKLDGTNVLRQDRRYLVAGIDLGAVIPAEDDTLDFGNGDVWTIVRVMTDPARAVYILQVRK